MGSNPVYSKSVNSFCSNNKLSHLSSLLQYNYLTKINHLFLFAKIFFHRNSTTPSPIHYPSYAHAQCRNIEKSTPQARTTCLCWYLYLLVYELRVSGRLKWIQLNIWIPTNCHAQIQLIKLFGFEQKLFHFKSFCYRNVIYMWIKSDPWFIFYITEANSMHFYTGTLNKINLQSFFQNTSWGQKYS